jgi:hypothetical protein
MQQFLKLSLAIVATIACGFTVGAVAAQSQPTHPIIVHVTRPAAP